MPARGMLAPILQRWHGGPQFRLTALKLLGVEEAVGIVRLLTLGTSTATQALDGVCPPFGPKYKHLGSRAPWNTGAH